MIRNHSIPEYRGMTLMETVIAIGVIGFAVPMILAGTTASLKDRSNAEADTRSAWIAKDLENQVSALWATPRQYSYLPSSLILDFPITGTEAAPLVLIYNNQGKFLKQGALDNVKRGVTDKDAQYIVTLYSTAYHPPNLASGSVATSSILSRLMIKVEYPAKARLEKRQSNLYWTIKTKQSL